MRAAQACQLASSLEGVLKPFPLHHPVQWKAYIAMCVYVPACRLVRRVDRTDANLRTCTFGVRLLFQAKRNINAGEELLC